MLAEEIVMHPLAESEVERLIHAPWPGGKPERHQDRFGRQQRDEVLYLIGWRPLKTGGGYAARPSRSADTARAGYQRWKVG